MSTVLAKPTIMAKPDSAAIEALPNAVTQEDGMPEALAAFKAHLAEKVPEVLEHPYFQDRVLALFLTARKRDVALAATMVTESYKWRIKTGADKLLDEYEPPPYLAGRYLPGGLFGVDKDNDPVVYSRMGAIDPNGICNGFPPELIEKIVAWRQEVIVRTLDNMSIEQGRVVSRVLVITDLSGLGMRHCVPNAFSLLKRVIRIQEDHYPERLKVHIVIRAPSIFSYAWSIVSKYLDERTRAKFVVAGSDWEEVLRRHVSEEHLPAMYGGKATIDGDPECRAKIPPAGPVASEHILADKMATDTELQINVRAGSTHEHKVEVSEPGQLHWLFHLETHDIDFSVRQGRTVVHGGARISCTTSEGPVCGSLPVNQPGTFSIVFDNSYSWTKTKSIKYRIWTEKDGSSSSSSLLESASAPF